MTYRHPTWLQGLEKNLKLSLRPEKKTCISWGNRERRIFQTEATVVCPESPYFPTKVGKSMALSKDRKIFLHGWDILTKVGELGDFDDEPVRQDFGGHLRVKGSCSSSFSSRVPQRFGDV